MKRIYLSPPHFDGREKELLCEAYDSNWITTMGPHVDLFEREVCQKVQIGHAAALASGTAAIHLALLILGIRPGDEVVCSDLTFVATANAIHYCGAKPVFIDSHPSTWNMDPVLLERALEEGRRSRRMPKAVIPVDLYGQCADYKEILAICSGYQVPVVEDAAEALGATYDGRSAGRFGVIGIFSFNGNKIITTSGGGMLVSENEAYVRKARFLASQAREPLPYYQHLQVGFNYRMSNLLAAIGRGQLERLDQKIERRRSINRYYRETLDGLPGIEFMPEAASGRSNSWLTVITVDPDRFGMDREGLRLALEAENIESRPAWKPMHLQPVYRDCRTWGGPVSENIFDRGLCLPSGNQMSQEDLERVSGIIRRCYRAGGGASGTEAAGGGRADGSVSP